jgi:hypothetical protein
MADHVAEQRAAALLEFSRVLARRPRGARQAQCHQNISAQAREARGDLARVTPAACRAAPAPTAGLHRDSALAVEYRLARTLAADSVLAIGVAIRFAIRVAPRTQLAAPVGTVQAPPRRRGIGAQSKMRGDHDGAPG